MIRAAQGRRTILVTDAGRGTAIAMIRSLARHGYRVLAADWDAKSPGFRSRYVAGKCLYPFPMRNPDAFLDAMLQFARNESIDLIIPVTDDTILPLSAHRREFPSGCRLAIPDADQLEVTTNKQKTLELARRHGAPTPRTVVVKSVEESIAAAEQFRWPVVLKPLASRRFRNHVNIEHFSVGYAESAESLAAQMAVFEGRTAVLLQEYVSGTGFGVELLLEEGRVVAAFQHRRLREIPVSGGASSYRESVPLDPTLFDYSARMLTSLNWTGLAMIEFKSGPEGVSLMEINGRPWGSLPLAVASGVDFPKLLAAVHLNGPLPSIDGPQSNYRIGVRSRNLELDLMWIGTVLAGYRRYPFLPMPRRIEALSAACGLLNPAGRFDIQSFDDPWPGIAEIPKVIRKVWRKLAKRKCLTYGTDDPRTFDSAESSRDESFVAFEPDGGLVIEGAPRR